MDKNTVDLKDLLSEDFLKDDSFHIMSEEESEEYLKILNPALTTSYDVSRKGEVQ